MSEPCSSSLPFDSESNASKSENSVIGPALPPHLSNKQKSVTSSEYNDESTIQTTIVGPSLPPHLLNRTNGDSDDSNDEAESTAECSVIGPVLPKHLLNQNDESNHSSNVPSSSQDEQINTVGPILPPHLRNKNNSEDEADSSELTENENVSSSTDAYGPTLPPHLQNKPTMEDDSSDEDVYGPLPAGVSINSQAHQALEERALKIKLGYLDSGEEKGTIREEWMLELPEVGASKLGLGPRQFRKNQKPDFSDRTSWTDTPEQKAKKSQGKKEVHVDLKKEAELREIQKRDDEQAKMAQKHNKKRKRDKSLLELHQDKLKQKKKEDEEEGLPTRRPFNREIDLKVNQFDDAQKKSILKKAMHLDDRFSGGQSKFL